MLTAAEGTTAVHYARTIVTDTVTHHATPSPSLTPIFKEKHGVFVTLHTHPAHDLRGCIGIPYPDMPLKDALIEAARSATHDPRFPPLHPTELDHIIIEVTILSTPTPITITNPQDLLHKIKIGRDGLIVEQGYHKGLLLPQVPVEEDWDVETYLGYTCMKAGLPADAWLLPTTKFSSFTGQIFTETTPHSSIQEKHLHGPQH